MTLSCAADIRNSVTLHNKLHWLSQQPSWSLKNSPLSAVGYGTLNYARIVSSTSISLLFHRDWGSLTFIHSANEVVKQWNSRPSIQSSKKCEMIPILALRWRFCVRSRATKCDDPIVTCSPNGTRQRSTVFTSAVSCSDTINLRKIK